MALPDIDATMAEWSARTRARLIAIGKDVGSDRSLELANLFINGLKEHGPKLKGIGERVTSQLVWGRDALTEATVGRGEKRVDIGVVSERLGEAMRKGGLERADLRVLLLGAHDDLLAAGDEDEADAIDGALQRTGRAAEDAGPLADQVVMLANVLARPAVRAVVEADVEAELVEVNKVVEALRALDAQSARPLGTPEETQRMDLLDGWVITLARRIHKAAMAAAKRLGDDALRKAFSLESLYRVAQPGRNTPPPVG